MSKPQMSCWLVCRTAAMHGTRLHKTSRPQTPLDWLTAHLKAR